MKNTYELGKIVGAFLYTGRIEDNGISLTVGGYGPPFTRNLQKFIIDFGNKNNIEVKRNMFPDSSGEMLLYSKELRDEIENLIYKTEHWECPMTADGIVDKSKNDIKFKEGVLYMMEREQEYEFRAGIKMSYEEEKKIWDLM